MTDSQEIPVQSFFLFFFFFFFLFLCSDLFVG